MDKKKEESISGPIGELIAIISEKCNVKESMGYFLSKNKIAFLSIVALVGKIVYAEDKRKLEKDENYIKIIEQLSIDLLVDNKNGKDVIETIITETESRKYK